VKNEKKYFTFVVELTYRKCFVCKYFLQIFTHSIAHYAIIVLTTVIETAYWVFVGLLSFRATSLMAILHNSLFSYTLSANSDCQLLLCCL